MIQDDTTEVSAKRMQLLKDAVPRAAKVAVLFNHDEPYDRSQWQQLEPAARSLNLTLQQLAVRRPSEFEDAFSAIGSDRPDAILTTSDSLSFPNRGIIIDLALKNRLPVMAAYGSVRVDRFRRAALYVGKILKGAKPADLPVEQPSKYELVINLKTPRSLDLEIHHDLLLIADEVVE